jgi:hypothetical protein
MNDTASLKELDEAEDSAVGGDGGRNSAGRVVRLLVGGRIAKNRRLRRLLLAHLLKERMEDGEQDAEDIDSDEGDENTERERKLVKLLVAGGLARHRQLRRMLLAHLLKERMEGAEDDDESIDDEGEDDDAGSERARKLARLLVAGRMRRHQQLRRLLAAHLAREAA